MTKSGMMLWVSFICVSLAACNHPTTSLPSTNAAHATGPVKPAATADDNAWRDYLSEQGKIYGKDVQGHPYIYLIPGGDSPVAETGRKNVAQSISFAIGPIVIPGSLLVIGGPDAKQTNQFAAALPKAIKAGALQNVVVLIVSDMGQEQPIKKAFEPTSATLRFVTM